MRKSLLNSRKIQWKLEAWPSEGNNAPKLMIG